MSYILDIIVVGIVLLSIVVGHKKGFIKTAFNAVGLFLALYLAFVVATPVSNYICSKAVRPSVVSKVNKAIDNSAKDISVASENIWNTLPDYVRKNADKLGISINDVNKDITDNSNKIADDAAGYVADEIVLPITEKLIAIICTLLIFIILSVLIHSLEKVVDGIFKLPILYGLNQTFGGILGIVNGFVLSLAFCVLISAILTVKPQGFMIFNQEYIDSTHLFRVLYNLSPFV